MGLKDMSMSLYAVVQIVLLMAENLWQILWDMKGLVVRGQGFDSVVRGGRIRQKKKMAII